MCALAPAGANCAAGFHFSFIRCSSREQMMWPCIWHPARGSKTQLHWWFTTKDADSLSTQPSWWQSALTHWRMRFYQLTIVYIVISEEFTLPPCMTTISSQVFPQSFLEIKVAAWRFTDTVRTHRWQQKKIDILSGLPFWGMFGLCQFISPKDKICQPGKGLLWLSCALELITSLWG